ncbi:MFS general substrate transporter [Mollisia scopiformis]|uniref:MFS general substrate transporter n=1 Tax=Mollisia scopiformis TaxID=149040 RepID=A0A132B7W3_MOLSC|nr:MFS general substrate transporter [Mollisia scopiformis]KUJ08496.1 MFS general substrate transporter [Mollisia scopiformis]
MAIFQHIKSIMNQNSTLAVTEGVEPAPTLIETPTTDVDDKKTMTINHHATDSEIQKPVFQSVELGEEGAQRIELMQEAWGKHGKLFVFLSLALCMIVYELDNTTFATYYVYAISDFKKTASTSALSVACNLTFSLMKPVWAKISDIFGRGEMYPTALLFITIGLVVAASAQTFQAFAVGTILRIIGITCLNTMNTIVIADLTSTRQRALGVNFLGGIGWAWGIGILAIVYPFGVVAIMSLLLKYQSRAKKLEAEYIKKARLSVYEVCSSIDIGGMAIMILGLAFILLPLSLASLQPHGYKTPWIPTLMVIGGLLLIFALPFYESKVAAHPFFPVRYLKHKSICLAFLLYFTDYMTAEASHGYLYNWALIAQGLTIVQATNLSYINGVMTFATGILFGLVMWKTRTYKWWIVGGLFIRIIRYRVMFRIRTSNPTLGELLVVQLIQGVCDGIVQTGGYVAATINVPHKETAQMAALIVMVGTLGSSIGDAISGAIYTGTFREQLRKQLGDKSTPELVEALFNSITTMVPEWGTPERTAINAAYNNVTSYFYIAAMVIIVPGFIIAWFLPNQTLNDNQNLLEDHGMLAQRQTGPESENAGQ